MRTRFDEQLRQLNVELIRMGSLCEEAISIAAKALEGNEKVDAGRVFSLENDIDQMEHDIESRCMRMLLQQQPVATDLRVISAALKMISDMERIGDQAADIAEITRDIADNSIKDLVPIGDMARATIKMVTDSVATKVKREHILIKKYSTEDPVTEVTKGIANAIPVWGNADRCFLFDTLAGQGE
mgnify:CR=1 FL=1